MGSNPKGSPKEIRRSVGVSQARVAVAAGVSEPTVRLYEANPLAVSDACREALEPIYETIAKTGALALRVAS